MVQFLLKLTETDNFCCAPRFPMIASCYSLLCHCWQPNFFHVMLRGRKFWNGQSRKILEARSWSRTFHLRLCNPVGNHIKKWPVKHGTMPFTYSLLRYDNSMSNMKRLCDETTV